MIINFPFVKMPHYLTDIMQVNLSEQKDQAAVIFGMLSRNPATSLMVKKYLSYGAAPAEGLLERLRKNQWDKIRNGLAALCFYHYQDLNYPVALSARDLSDVLQFEDDFYNFAVKGFSRCFLLAYYLKFCEVDYSREFPGHNVRLLDSARQVLKLMNKNGPKSVKIDWLILMLWHFQEFFGEQTAEVLEEHNYNFDGIYEKFSDNYREIYMQNMLNYAASINDKGTLLNLTPAT